MSYTREEMLSLLRGAYNEGFQEGMRENSTFNGGKTWSESTTFRKLSEPATPQAVTRADRSATSEGK